MRSMKSGILLLSFLTLGQVACSPGFESAGVDVLTSKVFKTGSSSESVPNAGSYTINDSNSSSNSTNYTNISTSLSMSHGNANTYSTTNYYGYTSSFLNDYKGPLDGRETDTTGSGSAECALPSRTPGLNALANAIKTRSSATDQSPAGFEAFNCEAGLSRFAARAITSTGTTVTQKQIDGSAFIGVYCDQRSRNGKVALHIQMFMGNQLRGNVGGGRNGSSTGGTIAKTYLCRYGTNVASCSPSSADFIAGIEWGENGGAGRISSSDSFNDPAAFYNSALLANNNLASNAALLKRPINPNVVASAAAANDPSSLVKSIQVGSTSYSDLNECTDVNLYSPIIIERKLGEGVTAANPSLTNTLFDLNGDGKSERISCVTEGAFLALPNQSGQIVNINELFGDNTLGPDGQRSANGYLALGKHDSKINQASYGTITAADPVFSKLRLWEDQNCNGSAEPNELMVLESWGISAIRWKDPVRMNEIDPYGNTTLLRHFVQQADGGMLRSFDVWFRDFSNVAF